MSDLFAQWRFEDPWFLILLLAIPLLWLRRWWLERLSRPALVFPRSSIARRLRPAWTVRLKRFAFLMRGLALSLIILALARPQLGSTEEDIATEGIDIMMTLDISGSMAAEDFSPNNRLGVAKQVVKDFIVGRRTDRIGLVVFAARSFTKCPLTIDYDILLSQLDDVELGAISDGTAIGSGLSNAINRLRSSQAKSRVVILLTDGVSNSGAIDPLTAAQIAQSLGMKVYTVGVGRQGVVPFPVDDPMFGRRTVSMEVKIDEETLEEIASLTGGKFFRAVDRNSLEQIFQTIDRLERSEIQVKSYTRYAEIFPYFLWPGLMMILVEVILNHTRLRSLP